MDEKKRNRLPNFSTTEENLLITLAERYGNVIENKKTDAVSWEEKRKAWDSIDAEFQAQIGMRRGAKNLREKFENLKRKARKSIAEEKRELYKTGGGQFKFRPNTNTSRLAAIMGQTATGLNNDIDSDAIIICENDPEIEHLDQSMNSFTVEVIALPNESLENVPKNDWSTWSPALLRAPKTEKLTTKSEKNRKSSCNYQQIFWEEENKRAAEKHEMAKQSHELEVKKAEMKLQLLKLEIKCKAQQLSNQNFPSN